MSMSQEEIEALMNGLDIEDDTEDSKESAKVNTQEIEELLSQTEDYQKNTKVNDEESTKVSIDESKKIVNDQEETLVKTDEIEKLLNDIESNSSSDIESKEEELEEDFFDSFDNLESFTEKEEKSDSKETLNEESLNNKNTSENEKTRSDDDIAKDWTTSKIEKGIFPFPAEKDTKVVSQLNQVANDSEEKVSQIFDVLSLTLDNNNDLRNRIKDLESFINAQTKLLDSLNKKFPNINVFTEHLKNANEVSNSLNGLKLMTNDEDTKIFQAMELMQFNDINRQKIERVMSVIRKLSLYLNNLFEDDVNVKDIAIAKHIHGDSNDDLIGDDLDRLIAEFSKN